MIAYDEQGPVGWVSFGPREEFARLVASRVLQPVDDQPVTSVVCFVIAARARRQGVAHGAARGGDRLRGAITASRLLEGVPG